MDVEAPQEEDSAEDAPERSVQTYCKVWSDFESWADGVDDSDMSQLGVLVEELVDSLNRSAEVAPEEIQEESENIAAVYEQMMDEHDFSEDPEGTIRSPEIQESMAEIEAQYEDLDGDFETIESYIQQECGLDPNEL